MSDILLPTPNKVSWVKQSYFYIIMIGCMCAFAISSVVLTQKILTRYVFTKANYDMFNMYGYGNSIDQQCKMELTDYGMYKPVLPNEVPPVPAVPAEEKVKECVVKKTVQEADRKESEYQNTVLNSILTIIVTGIIFALHIKYVKVK